MKHNSKIIGVMRLACWLLLLVPSSLSAQTVGADDVIRIDTNLLPFEVSVTDAGGRTVKGLSAADFRILEDAVERPVAFFNVEQKGGALRPIAVVFVLDVSGSMSGDELKRLGVAVRLFVEKLSDRRSVFAIMTFGTKVRTRQSFTNERKKLDAAIDKLFEDHDEGRTSHAYDAADDAIRMLVKKAPRTRDQQLLKRAIVLVTDGYPVGDTVKPATVIERANAADVSIYSVQLPSYPTIRTSVEPTPLPTLLDVSGVVEKTGGKNVYATDQDFSPLFKALAEEVTSNYVLAFYPAEDKRQDGKFHNVRILGPSGLVLRQSRPGYTADPPRSNKK
ncbi:MAG: VWA domain-containing protein [Pyrinomonadaceae bacterium]